MYTFNFTGEGRSSFRQWGSHYYLSVSAPIIRTRISIIKYLFFYKYYIIGVIVGFMNSGRRLPVCKCFCYVMQE